MPHRRLLALLAAAATSVAAGAALAEPTLELYIRGPDEVFDGDPVTSSVDALGRISTGPVLVDLADGFDRPVVSMVEAPSGGLYVGTAGGGLVRLTARGAGKTLAPFEGKVVSALAVHRGELFAATSPDGEIASVSARGEVKPYFQPGAKYVWSMLPNGAGLIVATGAPGRVLEVSPGGKSKVLFDPGETHVRAMIRTPGRGLVVGGGQKGVVYQLEDGGAYALYDSSLEEVTAFAVDPRTGDLYAALVSAASEGALEPSTWIGPVKGDQDDEASPIKGSEVVRIRPSGHVEKVWTSKRDGALALHFDDEARRLYIATGASPKNRARIYSVRVDDRDRVFLDARLAPALATTLVAGRGGALLVGTAPSGRVIRVGPKQRATSRYLSVEQDLERISDIGRLWFDADIPRGAKVSLRIRTGNTKTPDKTWSPWSAPVSSPEGGPVEVRQARYAQIEAQLSASPTGEAPVLESMHASVVRMNVPPHLKEVYMLRRGVYMTALPPEGDKERTVTLSGSVMRELRRRFPKRRERTRVRQGEVLGMMTVAWEAEDDNGDDLLYRVRLRRLDGPGAKDGWRDVSDDQEQEFFSFDSRAYPDGRYQFEIVASDRPSNPPDDALTDRLRSEPFDVDNTAPSVTSVRAAKVGRAVKITARAEDESSALEVAEISIDGGPWLMLPASDGLIDAKAETFALTLDGQDGPGHPKLEAGNHTVRIRVVDRADNEATASARFRY